MKKTICMVLCSILCASVSFADDYQAKRASDAVAVQINYALKLMKGIQKKELDYDRTCEKLNEIADRLHDYYEDSNAIGRDYISSQRSRIRSYCRNAKT